MLSKRRLVFALTTAGLIAGPACTGKPKTGPLNAGPAATAPVVVSAAPIETMQWGDANLTCGQIKARYDALAPLVKDAGRLIRFPARGEAPSQGTSPITFIPLFGPLIAMGMDSASREQAAAENAQIDPDREFAAATIAHRRGHEALDRRQYLAYLGSQKGCP